MPRRSLLSTNWNLEFRNSTTSLRDDRHDRDDGDRHECPHSIGNEFSSIALYARTRDTRACPHPTGPYKPDHRRETGVLTYRQGLASGALLVAIGGAIDGVQVWPYNTLIDDSLLVGVRDYQSSAWRSEDLTGADLQSVIDPLELFLKPACICRRRAAR